MAAPVRTAPGDWVEAGLRALAAGGPDAVRVEAVAAALGVTKGGFYHHFADRRALLVAMLDRWEQRLVDEAVVAVEAAGGDARERLRALFAYAVSAPEMLATELAVREWARRDPEAAARLARVDERRTSFLRPLFLEVCASAADPAAEAEARTLVVMTLFVGAPLVDVDHGGLSREQVVETALGLLLA